MNKNKLLNLLCASGLVFLSHSVYAGTVYQAEAVGKNEEAALGNLKMNALRQSLQTIIPAEEIKKNAKSLRSNVFIRVNEYTSTGSDLVYTSESNKTHVSGNVDVDEDAIRQALAQIPELKGKMTASGNAGDPVKNDTPAAPSVNIESPANPFIGGDNAGTPKDKPDIGKSASGAMAANDFMQLVYNNKKDEIIAALKNGTDPNCRELDESGNPAGDVALNEYIDRNGLDDQNVIFAFLDAGADVLWKNDKGEYPVLRGLFVSVDLIPKVLPYIKSSLKDVRIGSNSVLGYLFNRSSDKLGFDVYKKILDLGNDPNSIEGSARFFEPLLSLSIVKDVDVLYPVEYMTMLLDAGADVNKTNYKNETAAFVAVESNALEHLKLLAAKGIDFNKINSSDRSLLLESVAKKNVKAETIDFLIKNGAQVNYASARHNNETPLIEAVSDGRADIVELLIAGGADVNAKGRNGCSVLCYAADIDDQNASVSIASSLLKAGAKPDDADNSQKTALTYAVERNNSALTRLLVENGADLNKVPESVMKGSDSKYEEIRSYLNSVKK